MKTKKLFIFVATALFFTMSSTVFAATPKPITKDLLMSNVSDDTIIQVLPDGGYIESEHGTFDSEIVASNGGLLMTYKEYNENYLVALEQEMENELILSPLSNSPWKAVNHPVVLKANETYNSKPFKYSGWRFSEKKFRAAVGTGTYLLWTSIGDSGLVGNEYEAFLTYQGNGPASHSPIYNGQPKYVDGGSSWLFFYTYNPVYNSRYRVANK